MTQFRTLDDASLSGQRVLVRVDLNVPTENGRVTDRTRIARILPTIHEIADKGGRVILLAHFGRPKSGPDDKNSLRPVAAALSEELGRPVAFVPATVGDIAHSAVGTMQGRRRRLARKHPLPRRRGARTRPISSTSWRRWATSSSMMPSRQRIAPMPRPRGWPAGFRPMRAARCRPNSRLSPAPSNGRNGRSSPSWAGPRCRRSSNCSAIS